MNRIIKARWVFIMIWVVAIVLLWAAMPNLGDLVREKGGLQLPGNYSSKIAEKLLNELNGVKSDSDVIDVVAVFHSEKELTLDELKDIENGISNIKANRDSLGISNIVTHVGNNDLRDQVVSKDKTTVISLFSISKNNENIDDIKNKLEKYLSGVKVKHYLTGSDILFDDFLKINEAGVKKTELITVGFILVVLLLIFRSPVTPIVSLFTIASAYVISLGTVTQLVDKYNYPFSSFTQVFLVLVLFGLGTDFNILLLSRFREELSKSKPVNEAIAATYKTAGKTILFSGLTVLIGFSTLMLAQFSIYRSASAVAIGILILLIEIFTVLPAFMKILGAKMFWPVSRYAGHKENIIISSISKFAVKKPVLALLLIAIIAVPSFFSLGLNFSYNSLRELNDSFDSVKALNVVSDSFGIGKALQTTVVLKNDKPMNNSESLGVVDNITESIKKINGVKTVYSVTQPKGEAISDLYMNSQTKTISNGIAESGKTIENTEQRINTVIDGMNSLPDFSKTDDLLKSSQEISKGLLDINTALDTIESGLEKGAMSATSLNEGTQKLKSGMEQMEKTTGTLSQSYNQLHQSLSLIHDKYSYIEQQINSMEAVLGNMNDQIQTLGKAYPQLQQDQTYITVAQTAEGLVSQITQLKDGLKELNENYKNGMTAFTQANGGLIKINEGQKEIVAGLNDLESGSGQLSSGLNDAVQGQEKIITNMQYVNSGMQKVNKGQQQVNDGLDKLNSEIVSYKEEILTGNDNITKLKDKIDEVNKYLSELSDSGNSNVFYIPKDNLQSTDFSRAIDLYMSNDRKMTKLNIELSIDPYSDEASKIVDKIYAAVGDQTGNTSLKGVQYEVGGVSSWNNDLNKLSSIDFSKVRILVLIGIFVVMVIITRSVITPVIIVASLLIAQYSALFAVSRLFENILNMGSLTGYVPFFSFIMITALGVDYSIFLIDRHKEYQDIRGINAILKATSKVGGVIASAAMILSGTFAAMYPSGVLTLVQLATVVIIGLVLIAFVLLPLFMPAVISLKERIISNKAYDFADSSTIYSNNETNLT